MTGGSLLQLIAYGTQDLFLTGDNYFKKDFLSKTLENLYSREYINFEIDLNIDLNNHNIIFRTDINLCDFNNNNLFVKCLSEQIKIEGGQSKREISFWKLDWKKYRK